MRSLTATDSDVEHVAAADPGLPPDVSADSAGQRRTRALAIALWMVGVFAWTAWRGVALDRTQLFVIICAGLVAASVRRGAGLGGVALVLRDWLPFAAVLFVYDLSRGAATLVGRPTQWRLQISADRWLFGGGEPTVWLQEHLKQATAPWWEVGVSAVYVSFFVVPYAVAAVLWLRDRNAWRRYVLRFLTIAFVGLACFVAFPAAPPWAASVCTAAEVADGPSGPPCMAAPAGSAPHGGLLGGVTRPRAGAAPYVERISNRGWDRLGLSQAKAVLDEGQSAVNQVAAVPSLHAAISALVAAFLWPRVRRRWRPLLAGYPLAMAFALVYAAEHYVFDILLGWLLTAAVTLWYARRDRSRVGDVLAGGGRTAPDILDGTLLSRP